MKKFLLVSIVALIAVFGATALASAANTVNVTAQVNNAFTVALQNTSVSFDLTQDDIINGTVVDGSATPVLTVKSNKLVDVSHQAEAFVGATAGNAYVLPIGQMHYSVTGAGTVADTAFTTNSTALFTDWARGVNVFTNHYTLRATLDDVPDTYTTTVTYSVVQK